MNNTRQTRTLIGLMILAAVSAAGYAATMSHAPHLYLAIAVLALAAATSRMKVKLPGVNGNMSMNLPFLLTAVVTLSAAEAAAIAVVSTAVQCWPRKNANFNTQQMMFNVSMMMLASSLGSMIIQSNLLQEIAANATLRLIAATLVIFLGQTVPVAGIVAVSESKSVGSIWWNLAHLSFPYYVLSAGVTTMVQAMSSHLGWGLALAVFPVMCGIHRSYRVYFAQLAEALQPQSLVKAAHAGA